MGSVTGWEWIVWVRNGVVIAVFRGEEERGVFI